MARVKGAMMTRKRRNKVLKLAKGYWGSIGLPGTFFSSCKEGSWKCTVFEAGIFMYESIFD